MSAAAALASVALAPLGALALVRFGRKRVQPLEPSALVDGATIAFAAGALAGSVFNSALDALGTETGSVVALPVVLIVALLAFALWIGALAGFDFRRQSRPAALDSGKRLAAASAAAGVALAVLTAFGFLPVPAASVVAAAAAVVSVIVRARLSHLETVSSFGQARHEAETDALTGLGNRRKLIADLQHELRSATARSPRVLALFDLDGFKRYNDTFGHPAGDTLLTRLGANLGRAIGPYGRGYRLGGDEFCVLVTKGGASAKTVIGLSAGALADHGGGFAVKASYGAVMLPHEARDAAAALRVADQRMYSHKESRRASATRQTRDILLQVLSERAPDLGAHIKEVSMMARGVGTRLALEAEELDEVVRAAELHDVGKMAVPDEVLNKPGPLTDEEWNFIRQHTIVGERILSAAPALTPVAKLVRASHERWDGGGYPDGLAGREIPLGARIVAVCDAFHAMTSSRPYRTPVPVEEAIGELRRNAGAQFDPEVVQAFVDELSAMAARQRVAAGAR